MSFLHQCLYLIFGPTTVYLQHEIYLWISVLLLTCASMQGLYRDDFGLSGDFSFLSVLGLWLGRHFVIRWLCTWDASTTKSPTLRNALSVFLTLHLTGGQVFDRPTEEVVTGPTDSKSRLLPYSLLYILQWLRVRVLHPLQRLNKDRKKTTNVYNAVDGPNTETKSAVYTLRKCYQTFRSFWLTNGLTLQFVLPLLVTVTIFLYIFRMHAEDPDEWTTELAMRNKLKPLDIIKPHGAYHRLTAPSSAQVLAFMAIVGTSISLITFQRIILPIPDQVAGGNVLKDTRQDVKTPTKAKMKVREQHDTPWTEQVNSIVNENRILLHVKVAACRLLENMILCYFLTRSPYICRCTGHCPEGTPWWQLTRILYPIGVTTPLRQDTSIGIANVPSDFFSSVWSFASLAGITLSLLLSESIVLDKTYMSVLGYILGHWEECESQDAPPWDPRRKYKKGDVVLYEKRTYQATTNEAEGRPMRSYMTRLHRLLRNEMGHQTTSPLILLALKMQVVLIGCYFTLWILLGFFGISTYGLLTAISAHIVAAYGVANVGMHDYKKLERLGKEISAES